MPQYFSFNPTHHMCWKMRPNPTQPNPWMDPTHVHLCYIHSRANNVVNKVYHETKQITMAIQNFKKASEGILVVPSDYICDYPHSVAGAHW